jgi:hypothetical protein
VQFRIEDPQLANASLSVSPGGLVVVLGGGGFADNLQGDARRVVAWFPEAELLQGLAAREEGRVGDRQEEIGVNAEASVGLVPAAGEVDGDEGVDAEALGPGEEDQLEEGDGAVVEGVLGHVFDVEEGARERRRGEGDDGLGHAESRVAHRFWPTAWTPVVSAG